MIHRNISNIVKEVTKHFPITLLTGPRQIGKSTLLFHYIKEDKYTYVSLDDTLELALAKNDPISFLNMHKPPLIIDEVQKAPELFPELEKIVNKSRLENGNKNSNGMYILSGSSRQKLLENSKESLSGRVAILDMNNLSLNEIFNRSDMPFKVDIMQNSNRCSDFTIDEEKAFDYITRGFFPALYDDLQINTSIFYSSYLSTYIEKDLKEFIDVKDTLSFIDFLKILASNTGEELIYDNYAKQVGVALNTIKSWISVLTRTGIIYLVEPYNEESIVKRVVKRPKMYFFDTGLASYLCGINDPNILKNSFLKGRFFETFIFNEIRKSFINNGQMQDMFYYRDTDQNEIDLILVRDGQLSCVEIKTGQTFNVSKTKAFKKMKETKLKIGKNAIVCTVDKISMMDDGTILLPISSI